MALTQLKTSGIADDAVTEDKIANAINTARAANTAKDLTALSAANLTSGTIPDARFPATLPAASGANLTNVPVKTNLVINGAMQVAQRGTSSTVDGYGTVDRFQCDYGTVDEAPTQAQVDVTSGTEPYTKGFRKAFKITNGNQTSGAQAASVVRFRYCVEAQDIANSGWNYLSSSSSITLSFYIKSSIAQNFFCDLQTADGTAQGFSFQTGSLSADTWTKITKTISGNSNLTFNSNNGHGVFININGFMGTDFTTSGHTLDTWGAFTGSSRVPDNITTWYTTNNSTLEITGVQLEVGSTASDFIHESYADTFLKCQRYYHVLLDSRIHEGTYWHEGYYYTAGMIQLIGRFSPEMRATPNATITSGTNYYRFYRNGSYDGIDDFLNAHTSKNSYRLYNNTDASGTAGHAGAFYLHASGDFKLIAFDAEL